MTNKILLEAGYSRLSYDHAGGPGQLPPDGIFDIGVTEQSTAANPAIGYTRPCRAPTTPTARCRSTADNWSNPNHWRASASYVTGSHNMKVGYQGSLLINETNRVRNDDAARRTASTRASPTSSAWRSRTGMTADTTSVAAFFVQDTWTRGRLTLQGALRYDRAWSWSPAGRNGTTGTSALNPAPIPFDKLMSVDAYNDITPRFGVAYDVFGNGKTALKFNMGHYLDAATNDSAYTRNNPANRIVSTVRPAAGPTATTTRSWTATCSVADRHERRVRGADRQRPELRQHCRAASTQVESGHAEGLGRARERLAVGRDGAAGAACRACRSKSATPAAGSRASP